MIKRTYSKRSLEASTLRDEEPPKRRRLEPDEPAPTSSSSPTRSPAIFSDENIPDWTPPSSPNRAITKAIIERHINMSEEERRQEEEERRNDTHVYFRRPSGKGSRPNHIAPLLPSKSALNEKKEKNSEAAIAEESSKAKPKPKPKRKPTTQMRLDFGQQIHKRCTTCGMEYRPSIPEDKKLHEKFHTRNVDGIPLHHQLGQQLRMLEDEEAGIYKEEIILPIARKSNHWRAVRRLVHAALEVVETELGGVGISEEDLWEDSRSKDEVKDDRFKTFLFVRKDKILGVCLAERISEAYPVLAPSKTNPNTAEQQNAITKVAGDETITIADQAQQATMGISRIWVSKCARGQGIADKLLRFAAKRFIYRVNIPREQIAFSQPTTSGAQLARRFFGKKSGWLVYSG